MIIAVRNNANRSVSSHQCSTKGRREHGHQKFYNYIKQRKGTGIGTELNLFQNILVQNKEKTSMEKYIFNLKILRV